MCKSERKTDSCYQQHCRALSDHKIILFGSRARGDHKPTSDIDLAVFPLPEFKNKGSFSSDIDDMETLLKIDLVFVNEHTDPTLLDNVKKEGVILYERPENQI